jgi:hypothetical protein
MEKITFLFEGKYYEVDAGCDRNLPIGFTDGRYFSVVWTESDRPEPTDFQPKLAEEAEHCVAALEITTTDAILAGMEICGWQIQTWWLVPTTDRLGGIGGMEYFADKNRAIAEDLAASLGIHRPSKALYLVKDGEDEGILVLGNIAQLSDVEAAQAKILATAEKKTEKELVN